MRMSREMQQLASAAVAGLIATLIFFQHVNSEDPAAGNPAGREVATADNLSPWTAMHKGLIEGVNLRAMLPPKAAEQKAGGK